MEDSRCLVASSDCGWCRKFLIDNRRSTKLQSRSEFGLLQRAMILLLMRQPTTLLTHSTLSKPLHHNIRRYSSRITNFQTRISCTEKILKESCNLRQIAAFSCESARMSAQPKWTATKVRKEFFDFFAERQHTIGEYLRDFREVLGHEEFQ